MDLNAKPYRAFVRVADLGSFTRAAEALCVSQPALSAQIRELERLLGFSLFHRHNRRVSLTAEGRIFLDKARRLVLETDWINQSARDIRENQLRIGVAYHSSAIPMRRALIEGFMTTHPKIPLSVVGRTHAQLLNDLRAGMIDIAMTIEVSIGHDKSVVEPIERGFERCLIATRNVGFAVPESHEFAQKKVIGVADIRGREIATVSRAHGVGLSEQLARRISMADGILVHPPEGDALSVLHYAAAMGWAAVDLQWFEPFPSNMKRVACPDLEITTQLEILVNLERRDATESFLLFAQEHGGQFTKPTDEPTKSKAPQIAS